MKGPMYRPVAAATPAEGKQSRWYPAADQLKDPVASARTLKQVLDQLYALQDSHAALTAQVGASATGAGKGASASPPGSGPTATQLCGLRVAPINTDTLANGATLKYNKANGNFEIA